MHIDVTALATDSAMAALSVATTFTICAHNCYTNVNIAVTVLLVPLLSFVTNVTLVCTVTGPHF